MSWPAAHLALKETVPIIIQRGLPKCADRMRGPETDTWLTIIKHPESRDLFTPITPRPVSAFPIPPMQTTRPTRPTHIRVLNLPHLPPIPLSFPPIVIFTFPAKYLPSPSLSHTPLSTSLATCSASGYL